MTILDKQFLNELINFPPKLETHNKYVQYLEQDIQHLFKEPVELLIYVIDENSNCDISTFLLCKYQDMYIFIEIKNGTCSGCFNSNIKEIGYEVLISQAIEQSYITTNVEDIKKYASKRFPSDSEVKYHFDNLQ